MEKLLESSKFVSHWVITSGKYDSRKHSHPANFEQRPQPLPASLKNLWLLFMDGV